MRYGYGKIGRSMPLSLEKCGNLGGDVEMASTVATLAMRNPQHTFVLIGRNDNSEPTTVGLPPNVENPWVDWAPELRCLKVARGVNHSNLSIADHRALESVYDELTLPTILGLDGIVLWAGQHGTTNAPLPSVRRPGEWTKPHDWSAHYCSFLLRGVNLWRDQEPAVREEVWLNSDARNYLKLRDLKWPLRHPVLAQYTYEHNIKHARYGDPTEPGVFWSSYAREIESDVWAARVLNRYARLEVNGLVPGSPFGDLIKFSPEWDFREPFGLFINETRRYVNEAKARVNVMKQWVLPLEPSWVHGTWSDASKKELGMDIGPAPWDQYFPLLNSTRCTFTTPASGTGWATAKPWEAFAAGTVCFFHPAYDDHDHVLEDADPSLREWLRVSSPAELAVRVKHLSTAAGRGDWEWLVRAQREHYDKAVTEMRYARIIEARLGLRGEE